MSQSIGVCGLGWPLELLDGVGEFAARWPDALVEWDRLNPLHGLETRAIAFVVSYPPPTIAMAVDPGCDTPLLLEKIGALTWKVPTPSVLWIKVDVARPAAFHPPTCENLGATIAYEWRPGAVWRNRVEQLGEWLTYVQAEIPSPQQGQKATEAWFKLRGFRHSAARLNARGGLRKFVRAVYGEPSSPVLDILDASIGHVALDPSDRGDPWPGPISGKPDTGPL